MRIELKLENFKGFYNSHYESFVDECIQNDLENIGKEYDDVTINYDFTELAKGIFDFYKNEVYTKVGFISNLEFWQLYSPKYYNFRNDEIYFKCDIDLSEMKNWLIDLMTDKGDLYDYISDEIKTAHTSCDGFTSFHSNDIKSWFKDLLNFEDDKHNRYKLSFILAKYLDAEREMFDEFDYELNEYINCSGCVIESYEIIE